MPWWRNGNGPPPGSRDDAEHTAAATNAPHNRCWGRGSGPRPDQRRPPGGNADYLHVAHVNVAYALGQQGPRGRHRLVGKMLTPALGIDCPGTGNKCLLRGNQGHRTPCPKKTFCSISAICSAPRAMAGGVATNHPRIQTSAASNARLRQFTMIQSCPRDLRHPRRGKKHASLITRRRRPGFRSKLWADRRQPTLPPTWPDGCVPCPAYARPAPRPCTGAD
jgi:hypothetical protein